MLATIEEAEKRFDCKVGLIVIDTYSKGIAAGGGDENTARDQNAVAANLQRLHERKTLHIAAVGHTGKDEKRGARGSNAHLADVDTMVQISINGSVKTATVIKGNDQPEGVLTTFKLETVKLGVDEDGDDLTTAVVHAEQIAPAAPREKGRQLRPAERIALRALDEAINTEGKRAPANANIPKSARVVDLDVWRQHAYRLGISASTGARAKQVAFKRVAESLFGSEAVGCCDGIVWPK
jgi:AAA domain